MKLLPIFYNYIKFKYLIIVIITIIFLKLYLGQFVLIEKMNSTVVSLSLLKSQYQHYGITGFFLNKNNLLFVTNKNIAWFFLTLKMNIIKLFSQSTHANNFSLTVLFNEKKISLAEKNTFKEVGLYHLIVISGMHIVIIISMLEKLLQFLKFNPKKQKLIILFVCCIYLLLIKCTYPVLYQILKLSFDLKYANCKIFLIALIMLGINYDNFNELSFVLTIIIQIIFANFKNFNIAIINISLVTNLMLYKYNHYFNVFAFLYTPILIIIFEKIIFKLTLLNFIVFNNLHYILNSMYEFYYQICVYFNQNFNLKFDSWWVIFVFASILILINIRYIKQYENW